MNRIFASIFVITCIACLSLPSIATTTNATPHVQSQTFNKGGNELLVLEDCSKPSTIQGVEEPICTNHAWQMFPYIHKDKVVWQDYRNDPTGKWTGPGQGNSDIYMYNLTNKIEVQITTNSSAQEHPVVWGNIVVWEDYRDGVPNIYMYDLGNDGMKGTPDDSGERILSQNIASQLEPAIWGENIVWRDFRNDPYPSGGDIYLFNLRLGKDSQVCIQDYPQWNPSIHGNVIAWTDFRHGLFNSDIYMYDMGEDEVIGTSDDIGEKVVASGPKSESLPCVYGSRIAYIVSGSTANDLVLKNVKNMQERFVTYNTARSGVTPRLSGSLVAWCDARNMKQDNNYDIYMYDIALNEIIRVNGDTVEQTNPMLYGNKTVWQDFRNSNWDIYMFTAFTPYNHNPDIRSVDANPYSIPNDNTTECLVTCDVRDNDDNLEKVEIDLSRIGFSTTRMYDDETHGDIIAGDGVFSIKTTAQLSCSPGSRSLEITATDSEGATDESSVIINVLSNPPKILSVNVAPSEIKNDGTSKILFTAFVKDENLDLSEVEIDLSHIGGNKEKMYDDGSHGDVKSGDNVFSLKTVVAKATAAGEKLIEITARDKYGATSSKTVTLTVTKASEQSWLAVVAAAIYGFLIAFTYLLWREKRGRERKMKKVVRKGREKEEDVDECPECGSPLKGGVGRCRKCGADYTEEKETKEL